MKSRIQYKRLLQDKRWQLPFASLLFPVSAVLIVSLIGIALVMFGIYGWAIIISTLTLLIIVILRQDELAAALIIAAHLYVDWYLGGRVVALVVAFLLLCIFFLARSPRYPFVGPRFLWLWILLLILAFFPATKGFTVADGYTYYLDIMVGAMLTFWLGMVIVQDATSLRRFLIIFGILGTLLAVHTLIQSTTGVLLFGSSRFDAYLLRANNLVLTATTTSRVGSFFVDPNWNGTFFAMMLFLPLGVCIESKSLLAKAACLAATFIMLIAMLSTYSNGAWIGSFAGFLAFVVLVGRFHYRVQILALVCIIGIAIIILFPTQISLQMQHASGAQELTSRTAAWQTAINVMHAFPWTGIGLGIFAYIARADPYRDPQQYVPLAQPHNSYLELGAMAGLPVIAIFIVLLVLALWSAFRNWLLADNQARSLYAGGIASIVALSINSISINAWTLAPLAAAGWLILGAISSNATKIELHSTE